MSEEDPWSEYEQSRRDGSWEDSPGRKAWRIVKVILMIVGGLVVLLVGACFAMFFMFSRMPH